MFYKKRSNWLVHFEERELTTFSAEYWQPKLELDYFLSAKQHFRIIWEWVGVRAAEKQRWQIPLNGGKLLVDSRSGSGNRDFTISNLSFQARYRWELAPLSDLFIVYTRGSDLLSRPGDSFSELLSEGWKDRGADSLVIKLRYRMGS